jgi:hypothetical protein
MLQKSGFFSKDDERGEMPEEWAAKKTAGDGVMLCQIYAAGPNGALVAKNEPGQKMKTFVDGVELVELDLDSGNGQEQAKDNMRQYLYLMGKYGSMQEHLSEQYGKFKPKPGRNYVFAPRKPMPYKMVYPAVGPSPRQRQFSNFALHHNVSFERLKLFWNFANAYSKKTSDRKPLVEMMMNLYGIPRSQATEWANNFYTDISPGNEAITTLFNRVTWRGWNLVEGPASDVRHDDPKTRFDDFNVSAMPESRRPRMKAVAALNVIVERISTQMKTDGLVTEEVTIDMDKAKFNQRYNDLMPPMRAAMNVIRQFQDEDFIAFNPQLWIYKAKGNEWGFEVRRP